jgi:cytoskeleton protein RodZ
MESLGSKLKEQREKRNITLFQAAEDTRISLKNLKSLEEEKYDELPGGMYNRAFLRSYCEYLLLNGQEMLKLYEAKFSPKAIKPIKAKTPLPGTHSFKIHSLVIWSAMLLVSVTCLYFTRHWVSAVFSPYFSHPQSAPVIREEMPQPAPSEPVREAGQAPTPDSTSSIQAVPADVTLAGTEALAGMRLEFEVYQECWVSLRGDGKQVLSETLEPGSAKSFRASENFFLILGNAGGVRLKLNGELVKPLGKMGEVVRVLINEQNIKDLLEKPASG